MKEKVIGSIPINGSMFSLKKIAPYKDLIENMFGLVLVFGSIFALFSFFDLSDVQSFVDRFGVWAPIVFILTKAATIVFAPLSGAPLYPAAGALFGFWKGFWILLAGDVIGGTVAFYISRVYGMRITKRFVKSESSMMQKILDQLGTLKGYVFARFCFAPMPEVVCYAAGLTKMSYAQFIIVHMIFNAIVTAILAGAGATLRLDMSPLFLLVIFAVGTIATLAGGIWFYKRTR